MPRNSNPELFVVDGSNIATEGRSQPSLEQLNEAVLAFMDEHPNADITVVVDATFGHRISKKEVESFDEAVANNELVTPPAGAIGRGDAFVLSIANKANAGVLSNDSFQEFHGDYEWLFDEGRLIGGKPVPHVGWVFVARTPVRGPKSRQSVKEAKQGDRTSAKQKANQRVRPKAAPKSAEADVSNDAAEKSSSGRGRRKKAAGSDPGHSNRSRNDSSNDQQASSDASSGSKDHVNDLMPFLEFVEKHPAGTACTGVVESYASHGAYARTGDVLIYIPLRLMDDPAPRSARSALDIGESVSLVIVGFTPDRRSIDAALPHMAPDKIPAPDTSVTDDEPDAEPPAERSQPAKRAPRRTPAKKTAAKKTTAKKTAAKDTAAKKVPAKKTPAKKTAAKKTAAKKTAAKKTPAKKTAARKTPAKTAAKKTPAKKAPAKTAAKKTPAKKAPARGSAAAKATK